MNGKGIECPFKTEHCRDIQLAKAIYSHLNHEGGDRDVSILVNVLIDLGYIVYNDETDRFESVFDSDEDSLVQH